MEATIKLDENSVASAIRMYVARQRSVKIIKEVIVYGDGKAEILVDLREELEPERD